MQLSYLSGSLSNTIKFSKTTDHIPHLLQMSKTAIYFKAPRGLQFPFNSSESKSQFREEKERFSVLALIHRFY